MSCQVRSLVVFLALALAYADYDHTIYYAFSMKEFPKGILPEGLTNSTYDFESSVFRAYVEKGIRIKGSYYCRFLIPGSAAEMEFGPTVEGFIDTYEVNGLKGVNVLQAGSSTQLYEISKNGDEMAFVDYNDDTFLRIPIKDLDTSSYPECRGTLALQAL